MSVVNGYKFAETEYYKLPGKDKDDQGLPWVSMTFLLFYFNFSLAFELSCNERAFGYTLFSSEHFYYKCNAYVIPTLLNLETDSFKVTL